MNIGKFSVNNSVLVNILMVVILFLGVFSVTRLPREQFSEVPFYWVNIIVPYPGVSAADVEKTVTIKIEDEYDDIDKLKQIVSESKEGLSVVRVEFDDGISDDEFERLFQEAQTRFNKVSLPDGTLQPLIDDFSASDFLPVIEVVLWGETDYSTLNQTALRLRDKLKTINDVSSVDLVGSRDRQIRIEVNRQKMEALGISINEIVQAVRQRNVTIPGGTLETTSREYILRTVGELGTSGELNDIIVRRSTGDRQGVVTVGDLAKVIEDYDEDGVRGRFNGNEAIILRIAKVPKGNSIGVVDAAKEELEAFAQTMPSSINISLFNDSTVQIRDSINVLVVNSLMGFGLLVIILFVFIGFRNALMTALGIPLTFAVTFLVLELLGETLNSNVLFGLVLVLGLIVDHAIVITENSYRLQQEGLSRRDAAIRGTNEVVFPVIAATLTTVAAFLPLMLLPGVIGKFLRVIPLVVSIALLASTGEAILFLPAHFADWPGKSRDPDKDFLNRLKKGFSKLISRLYKRRGLVVGAMIVLFFVSMFLVTTVQQDLFSAEDYTLFYIEFELPPGSPRGKTEEVVSRFEQRLLPLVGNGEVSGVSSSIGFISGNNESVDQSNVAQITVDLIEKDEGRTRPIPEIIMETEELCADIPGLETIRYRKAQNGPPVSPPVSFRLFGDNYDHLIRISEDLQRKLGEYGELYNIEDNIDPGTTELRIRVNEGLAARYGLNPSSVGNFIRSSFDGIPATTIFKENEEVEVLIRYSGEKVGSVAELVQSKIPTPDGRLVPFSSVASVEQQEPVSAIKRVDGKREVTITSEAYSEENVPSINKTMEAYFNNTYALRYPDIRLEVGGEFADLQNLLLQILRIFLVGVFLIYMILGTQFKSYTQPILIILTVPFAFIGVILFLIITGTPFSTTVLYAGVALAGIAVNDSIVLISLVNDLRKEGKKIGDAVIEAATTRLRPILLTTITTIAGLLPTAIGIGGKSVVWGPMASTIIFGLLFSTITALFVIPSLYGLFYDKKRVEA
jgi:multidrug efflux pump subunit AcrB